MRAVLLFFALAGSSAGPISALTLSEIRTDVRLRIKDSNSTRQRFTDAQLLTIFNQAQRDVINATWAVSKSTSITLVSGTTYYSLPSNTLHIQRVTVDYANLPEVTLQQQDSDNSDTDWENDSGTPTYFFQDKSRTEQIGLAPFPTAAGTMRIIYYAAVSDLSSDSDVPFDAENRFKNYHDLIVYYAAATVFLIEGETQKAQSYYTLYETRLKQMSDNVGTKPFVPTPIPTGASQ